MHRSDVLLAQEVLQIGLFECGVALAVWTLALVEDQINLAGVEGRMQLRAGAALDAVDGPSASVLSERPMVGWVPVASGDHEREALSEAVDRLHHLVPLRYRKRASRAEIVLDIHHDQSIHWA